MTTNTDPHPAAGEFHGMTPGKMYRVYTYPIEGLWKKPRVFSMKFLDEIEEFYRFDARPLAGTQTIHKTNVEHADELPDNAPVMMPEIWREG